MKKMLKIATVLMTFVLMVSSFAFASSEVNPVRITESAFLMLLGIWLMSVGRCLRAAVASRRA